MDFSKHYFIETELPDFIMLIGIPGSGKSTWIREYNKDNKYLVISPDDIRKDITGNVSDQTQNGKVWQITKAKTIEALEQGQSVILDSTMTNKQRRRDFIKGLPPCNLKAKIFYVDPAKSKERIEKDIKTGKDRANVPPEIVDRLYDELMGSIKVQSNGTVIDVTEIEREGFQIIDSIGEHYD